MNDQPQNPSNQGTLCGLISCFLAVVAWLVVIVTWVWVLTRPRGTFNDQGGLMLTFIVMPLTFGAWCVGGPIALALGGRALKHVSQSEDASGERRIARTGVFLSRLLFWAGVTWLLFIFLVALIS
jgi:hypothetical protein